MSEEEEKPKGMLAGLADLASAAVAAAAQSTSSASSWTEENKNNKPMKTQKISLKYPTYHRSTCPFKSVDWDLAGYQPVCGTRVKRDIASLYSDPLPGIFTVPNEDDFTCVRALIIGNFDTPYEGGFFHFYIRFGPQYPYEPPRVSAMSCYKFGESVRFNPNMYENGTVCLSILGTWAGPKWSAANNLSTVLLSIQSIMGAEPLTNEPGYDALRGSKDPKIWDYDLYVRHETIRVSVLATLQNAAHFQIPPALIAVMKETFFEFYDSYIQTCDDNAQYDTNVYKLTLRSTPFKPKFAKLKEQLKELRETLKINREALLNQEKPMHSEGSSGTVSPASSPSPPSSGGEMSASNINKDSSNCVPNGTAVASDHVSNTSSFDVNNASSSGVNSASSSSTNTAPSISKLILDSADPYDELNVPATITESKSEDDALSEMEFFMQEEAWVVDSCALSDQELEEYEEESELDE